MCINPGKTASSPLLAFDAVPFTSLNHAIFRYLHRLSANASARLLAEQKIRCPLLLGWPRQYNHAASGNGSDLSDPEGKFSPSPFHSQRHQPHVTVAGRTAQRRLNYTWRRENHDEI